MDIIQGTVLSSRMYSWEVVGLVVTLAVATYVRNVRPRDISQGNGFHVFYVSWKTVERPLPTLLSTAARREDLDVQITASDKLSHCCAVWFRAKFAPKIR